MRAGIIRRCDGAGDTRAISRTAGARGRRAAPSAAAWAAIPIPAVRRRRRRPAHRRRDLRAQPAVERRLGRRIGGGLGGVLGSWAAPAVEPGGTADLSNNGDEVQFMGYVLDDANDLWADTFQRRASPTSRRRSSCSPAARRRAAAPRAPRRARSTARPTRRSTSTSTSSRSSAAVRRARGLRPGLRRRARGRPPRAEADRDRGAGPRRQEQDPTARTRCR